MKIAVNTRLLIKNKLEGIGWFTFETLKRLVNDHPEHEFYFIFDRNYDLSFIFANNVTPIVIGPQARHPILFSIWFNYSIARILKKIQADIFLSPDGYLSLKTNVPQIAVIHDLNFEHYPDDLPTNILKYYKKNFPKFAKKAKRIVTVSEFSKNDIIKQYGIDPGNIDVVYNGVNDNFHPIQEAEKIEIRNSYSNQSPYLIYVGSLHARKNIERMLLAFDVFKKQKSSEVKLVIVGEKIWKSLNLDHLLDSLSYKKDIIFTGRIESVELTKLIAASEGLVYVSYFEGFGIPIIEGMKSGIPVITSNVTSMPEIAGDAAILADPFSVESIAEAMAKVLDEKLKMQLIAKGEIRAKKFTWEQSASLLWNSIEKVIKMTKV